MTGAITHLAATERVNYLHKVAEQRRLVAEASAVRPERFPRREARRASWPLQRKRVKLA
jgi:hypothetical protein